MTPKRGDPTAAATWGLLAAWAVHDSEEFVTMAVGHVAQSVATRGYTPGVVTAPLVVAPFSLWAWRRLGAAGVPRNARAAAANAAVLLPVRVAACHAVARVLAPADPAHRGPVSRSATVAMPD